MSRYLPKLVVCFREGYTRQKFLSDLVAGITVGIIALPMALAFGIESIPDNLPGGLPDGLTPPAMGLFTAIIAGFLISALGGSRVQVGGPTGAFIVIIAGIAAQHGYTGLATATIMAGAILIIMGLCKFGAMIKFIPFPVITGFTSGIAVIIFSSQMKNFFGLPMAQVPDSFVDKWEAYAQVAWQSWSDGTWHPTTLFVAGGSLAALILLRKYVPRIPGAILVVIAASCLVALCHLDIPTIGTKYGQIPHALPTPRLPPFSLQKIRELVPAATTIAMLAAIESLLCAVVADGMIGGRHKADCELVAQGIANIASTIFGGIPATGAIARTAANVKSGAKTPIAGIIHAGTLLAIMVALGPLTEHIPLATLSAILVLVAWNMAEIDHFRSLLRMPRSDVAVLLTTFGLTVFTDLTLAVGVGLVLASLLFMKRMADVSNISVITKEFENDDRDEELAALKDPNSVASRTLPAGVEVYEINGPFFFGIADRLKDTLSGIERPPKVFILRMRKVPVIDASGLHALEEFHTKCRRQGTQLVLAGVHAQPLIAFTRVGFNDVVGIDNMSENLDDALNRARQLLGLPLESAPGDAQPEVARQRK